MTGTEKYTWGLILALSGAALITLGMSMSGGCLGAIVGIGMAILGVAAVIFGLLWSFVFRNHAQRSRSMSNARTIAIIFLAIGLMMIITGIATYANNQATEEDTRNWPYIGAEGGKRERARLQGKTRARSGVPLAVIAAVVTVATVVSGRRAVQPPEVSNTGGAASPG